MSVFLYSGTPGSGKSYDAVNKVFANLKNGVDVIANFAVKIPEKQQKKMKGKFLYLENSEITVTKLLEVALERGYLTNKKEHQCVVIVDEAGGRYNCRKSCEKGEKDDMTKWVDFFSQHMKMGYDFILIAQMDRMLDRQIRGCIETEYKYRKITAGNMLNMLPFITIIVFFPFIVFLLMSRQTMFIKVEYWYQVKSRIGSSIIRYKPKYAARYDRFKMFEGFAMSSSLKQLLKGQSVAEDASSISDVFISGGCGDVKE